MGWVAKHLTTCSFALMAFGVHCATAAEWWHGSYIWDRSSGSCENNDSIATYSDTTVNMWEQSCEVLKKTPLTNLKGAILDLSCYGEGEDLGRRRELLLDNGDGKVYSYPPIMLNRRCDGPPTTAAQCDFNKRIYRAEEMPQRVGTYQEMQFLDGLVSGMVKLTQYKDNAAVWTAAGSFGCSNGASICGVTLKTMLGEEVRMPFETVDNGGYPESAIVIPALRQRIYQNEKHATISGKPYGGLVASLLDGYVPTEDELTLPFNVYNFSRCVME